MHAYASVVTCTRMHVTTYVCCNECMLSLMFVLSLSKERKYALSQPKIKEATNIVRNGSLFRDNNRTPKFSHTSKFQQDDGGMCSLAAEDGKAVTGTIVCTACVHVCTFVVVRAC